VVSKRFYFDARAQYLRVRIDDIDGSLGIYELDGLYRLRPNISFASLLLLAGAPDLGAAPQRGFFNFIRAVEIFVRVAFYHTSHHDDDR